MTSISGHTGPLKPPLKYEARPGFFMQLDPSTDPVTLDLQEENFGLINRTYPSDPPNRLCETIQSDGDMSYTYPCTDWERFYMYLKHLRDTERSRGRMSKLLILARHGEGYHNVAEALYGTEAWNQKWCKFEGNGTITWADAHLTHLGETQARNAGVLLRNVFNRDQRNLSRGLMPKPDRCYVSPLMRCLRTAELTWSMIDRREPGPTIKEKLREVIGVHTCDRRSSRTLVHEAYPEWEIEEGFTEDDELWVPDHRETRDERDARSRELLDDIFTSDDGIVLSFTAHSGMFASLLRVTGHREFRLPTGGIMPLFVSATEAQ